MARKKKEEVMETAPDVGAADPSPDVEAVPVEASYADSAPDGPKLREVDVLVTKDIACIVASTVYAHEVPILAAAHGGDRVEVVAEREVIVPGFNPAAEMDRLQRKYKGRNKDPLREAYPLGLRDLVSLTGVDPRESEARSEALVKVRPLPAVRAAA